MSLFLWAHQPPGGDRDKGFGTPNLGVCFTQGNGGGPQRNEKFKSAAVLAFLLQTSWIWRLGSRISRQTVDPQTVLWDHCLTVGRMIRCGKKIAFEKRTRLRLARGAEPSSSTEQRGRAIRLSQGMFERLRVFRQCGI